MKGLWKAQTWTGLIWAFRSLKVVLAICRMLYFMSVGDKLNAVCHCAGKYAMDDTTWVGTCLQALFMSNHDHFLQIFLPFFSIKVVVTTAAQRRCQCSILIYAKGQQTQVVYDASLNICACCSLIKPTHPAAIKIYINVSRMTLISLQVLTNFNVTLFERWSD